MKLKAIVKGKRVHELGYRFFLFTRAMELGCERFFAKNQSDGGNQVVSAFIEGDEQQLAEFKMFALNESPEGADVADIALEGYRGPIMSLDAFLHYFSADQLNKGIPALLRIDRKKDKMLEKQDATIAKLEETRADLVQVIKTSRDGVISKLEENREAIIDEISEKKESLDDRLKRIESDISKLNTKVGI
jgi:acylphosphatase